MVFVPLPVGKADNCPAQDGQTGISFGGSDLVEGTVEITLIQIEDHLDRAAGELRHVDVLERRNVLDDVVPVEWPEVSRGAWDDAGLYGPLVAVGQRLDGDFAL